MCMCCSPATKIRFSRLEANVYTHGGKLYYFKDICRVEKCSMFYAWAIHLGNKKGYVTMLIFS